MAHRNAFAKHGFRHICFLTAFLRRRSEELGQHPVCMGPKVYLSWKHKRCNRMRKGRVREEMGIKRKTRKKGREGSKKEFQKRWLWGFPYTPKTKYFIQPSARIYKSENTIAPSKDIPVPKAIGRTKVNPMGAYWSGFRGAKRGLKNVTIRCNLPRPPVCIDRCDRKLDFAFNYMSWSNAEQYMRSLYTLYPSISNIEQICVMQT